MFPLFQLIHLSLLVGGHQLRSLSLAVRAAILLALLLVALLLRRWISGVLLGGVGTGLACLAAWQLSGLGVVWPWTDAALLLLALAVLAPRRG